MSMYLGKVERIEVRRHYDDAEECAQMLRGYGFNVALEIHCGFWLVHWTFPQLQAVS